MTNDDGRWTVRTRGCVEVQAAEGVIPLRPKERAVVAAIASAHPRPIEVDRIIDLVWERHPPSSARKSVHNHIARIRRVAVGLVTTTETGYGFGPGVEVDHRTPTSAGASALADLPDSAAVIALRQRLHAVASMDDEQSLEAAVRAGPTTQLIDRLHAAVTDEPYHEHRWYLLTLAQSQLGRRRDALLTYQAARQQLAEVGLAPGKRLRELERSIVGDEQDDDRVATIPVLHPHHRDPFVGRNSELARLRSIWADVVTLGQPHMAIVEGAPGMGKTRLVDTFCRRTGSGPTQVRVIWGRNRNTIDTAFGALTDAAAQVLRSDAGLADDIGSRLSGLWPLLPDLAPVSADTAVEDDLAGDRFARSLQVLIATVAREPTVWFVDDVQWASAELFEVLRRVVDGLTGSVLLVATRRPNEGSAEYGLAPLERLVPSTTIQLDGLSLAEVQELLMESSRGRQQPLTPSSAGIVHERTAGLPLYASEIARQVRLSDATIDDSSLPVAIRSWVDHRLAGLDERLTSLLRRAAVTGVQIDTGVLTTVAGASPDRLEADLDRLVALGFLVAGETGGVEFTHVVTRDAVYDSIGPKTLEHFHFATAEAIARATADAPDHLGLAHHYQRAGGIGRGPATEHALVAGEHQLTIGAWSQAAALFEAAATSAPDVESRATALVGLGRALLQTEQFAAADASLREAIGIAEEHGFPDLQARATLALVGRAGRGAAVGSDDAEQVALLRAALGSLGRTAAPDDRNRAMLMCEVERELALSLLLSDAEAERCRLLEDAVARARSLEPPHPMTLAKAVLGSRYAKLGPERLDDRLRDIDEVLGLHHADIGSETLLTAHSYQHEDLLRHNDRAGAAAALDEAERVVQQYPHPYWAWSIRTWRCLDHIIAGQLDRAEAMAFEAAAMRPGVSGADACLAVNLVDIRLYQGRSAEVVDPLEHAVAAHPEIPAYRAVLALCLSQAGEADRAAALLRSFADNGFTNLPADTSRFLALASLAHVAADVDDRGAARQLDPLLEPYGAQWVVLSCYGGGGASWGPTNHARARIAATLGDVERSRELFDDALQRSVDAPLEHARIVRHRDDLDAALIH